MITVISYRINGIEFQHVFTHQSFEEIHSSLWRKSPRYIPTAIMRYNKVESIPGYPMLLCREVEFLPLSLLTDIINPKTPNQN